MQTPTNVCALPMTFAWAHVTFGQFRQSLRMQIGDGSQIGAFVEVQSDAKIGGAARFLRHTFICSGVTIEDEVFVGHGVMFINDRKPRATNATARSRAVRTG